jgi:hypothetical protein
MPMPFVERDASGRVVAVFTDSPRPGAEELPGTHPDVLRFVFGEQAGKFIVSDLELVRVIEDIAAALIDRNILCLTDLPPAAMEKLARRTSLRSQILADALPQPAEKDCLFEKLLESI